MSAVVGLAGETRLGERRVALVPSAVERLVESDFRVLVEIGCGCAAGFTDADFSAAGAEVVWSGELFARSDVLACVTAIRRPAELRRGQIMVGPRTVREYVSMRDRTYVLMSG